MELPGTQVCEICESGKGRGNIEFTDTGLKRQSLEDLFWIVSEKACLCHHHRTSLHMVTVFKEKLPMSSHPRSVLQWGHGSGHGLSRWIFTMML